MAQPSFPQIPFSGFLCIPIQPISPDDIADPRRRYLSFKNIRYVESQPWPFSSSLIAGFQAEVDGDPTVHLNTDGGEELAEAVWVDRRDLRIEDSSVSLTWDMIRRFRDGSLFSSP